MANTMSVEDKITALDVLYEQLPVGEEVRGVSNKLFQEQAHLSDWHAQKFLIQLSELGIMKRRTTMGKGGKVAYWTLVDSKEDAVSKLIGKPQTASSLRNRIIEAIQSHGPFETVYEIITYISRPGENIDMHSVTHLLKAMREQGILSFKQSTSGRRGRSKGGAGNNIPFGIQYNPNFLKMVNKPAGVTMPESEAVTAPEPETVEATSITEAHEFPLIERLVLRREFLERAALLAEQGGESDLSLTLLEKAEAKLTPIEQEMVNLWNTYKACKEA